MLGPCWAANVGPKTCESGYLKYGQRLMLTFPLTAIGWRACYAEHAPRWRRRLSTVAEEGNEPSGNVTLTVFSRNSDNAALGSITLSLSQFCGPISAPACQSYFFHTLTFTSPVTLSPGSYTLVLSSNAPPQQNTAYFVKGNGTSFSAVAGDVVPVPDTIRNEDHCCSEIFTRAVQAAYAIQIINVGNAPSSGPITITDTLDPNLTFVSADRFGLGL